MQGDNFWNAFWQSGRVEDYLRYRGVDLAGATDAVEGEGATHGGQSKTASDDRRPGGPGL